MLVTITVCVRDGVQWIDGCLESLLNQSYRPLEIIAVDDGSSDQSCEALHKWHDPEGENGIPVRVMSQNALGLSAGRKLAVANAQGEWVAITDIDVRPERDWISNLVAVSNPVSVNEKVVAVTGRTIFESAEDVVSLVRSVEVAQKYRSRPRRTSLANGPCSMFNREALLNVGSFDSLWYHAEDMEVSLKLIESGGTIVYAPDAIVSHVAETGQKRFLAKRRRDARGHLRIVRKYPRRKRVGPGFDFIGSSKMVLAIAPLWVAAILSGLPFIYNFYLNPEYSWQVAQHWWQTRFLLISLALLLAHELVLWRGPLGVVNRGAIRSSPRRILIAIFKVRRLTFSWSIALWQGILLGLSDAIRGKNGH